MIIIQLLHNKRGNGVCTIFKLWPLENFRGLESMICKIIQDPAVLILCDVKWHRSIHTSSPSFIGSVFGVYILLQRWGPEKQFNDHISWSFNTKNKIELSICTRDLFTWLLPIRFKAMSLVMKCYTLQANLPSGEIHRITLIV